MLVTIEDNTTAIDIESWEVQKYAKLANLSTDQHIIAFCKNLLKIAESESVITGEQELDTQKSIVELCFTWQIDLQYFYKLATNNEASRTIAQYIAFLDIEFFGSENSELTCPDCGCLCEFEPETSIQRYPASDTPEEIYYIGIASCEVCGYAETISVNE